MVLYNQLIKLKSLKNNKKESVNYPKNIITLPNNGSFYDEKTDTLYTNQCFWLTIYEYLNIYSNIYI